MKVKVSDLVACCRVDLLREDGSSKVQRVEAGQVVEAADSQRTRRQLAMGYIAEVTDAGGVPEGETASG